MIFTTVVGSAGVIMPFFKLWDTKEYRWLRITVFLSMAFSSGVPVLHLVTKNGFFSTMSFFQEAAISVAMYLLGVVVCKCSSSLGVRVVVREAVREAGRERVHLH